MIINNKNNVIKIKIIIIIIIYLTISFIFSNIYSGKFELRLFPIQFNLN